MMEKLQPKLRFPEFDELWKINILGNLFDITAGGDIKKQFVNDKQTNEFKYPIYANAEKNKGLYGFSSIYKINEEVVTIAGRGNIGIAHARKEKFYPIVRLLVLKPKFQFSVDFFEYVINNLNIVEESTGVPQLTAPQISKYRVNYPSLPEQQKIASFLTTVDDKTSNLKQKVSLLEKYKKGVMQQIFSQQIRFKDTSGNDYPEWEEKSLGEVLIKNSKKNKDKSVTLVQSISNSKGFVNQSDYFEDRVIASKDLSNYYIIDKGFFAYNPSRIDVGSLAYKIDSLKSVISPLYISFKGYEKFICDIYLLNWFDSEYFTKQMKSSFEGSVRNTLSYESLTKITIVLPSIEEQTKIAEFLSGIDKKIETTKLQLSKMEVWKKGLLQGMFC